MAIQRNRKKLTTVLNNVDTRIRHLESRPYGGGAFNYAATAAVSSDSMVDVINTPISTVGPNAPSSYKRIISSKLVGGNLTGGSARIEIYTESPHGFVAGDKVLLYGVRRAIGYEDFSGAHTILDVQKAYSTSTKKIATASSGVYVFSFKVSLSDKTTTPITMYNRYKVSKYSAVDSTVTLKLASTAMHLQTGDVISVYGVSTALDGAFIVTGAQENPGVLTYNLDTPLADPIPETTLNLDAYAGAVFHEYVQVGDTWVDTSVTGPDTNGVYIWDGFKWVDYASSSVPDDGVAPKPPTNVSATSVGNTKPGGESTSLVTVTWTAPTQNANGKTLRDLAGYIVLYKNKLTDDWKEITFYGNSTSQILSVDYAISVDLYVAVKAFDSGKPAQVSTISNVYHLVTSVPASVAKAPSTPTLTSRLGVVTVAWDGKDYLGTLEPNTVLYAEVHYSTTSGFTPSSATFIGTITYNGVSGTLVAPSLAYNTTYYFRLVLMESNGIKTSPSAQANISVQPLVDTDIIGRVINGANIVKGSVTASDVIVGNTITGSLISALTIEAGSIKSNAITTDKLDVGAVTAEKISSRAITGDKILASTSITFADSVDSGGNPAYGSSEVIIGNHQVSGYPVTFTGVSFLKSGYFKGIIGTSAQWSDFLVGLDYNINALAWQYSGDIGAYNSYYRSSGGIYISTYGGNELNLGASGTLRLTSGTNTIHAMSRILMASGTTSDGLWGTDSNSNTRVLITPTGTMYPNTSTGNSTAVHQSASGAGLVRFSSSRRYKVLEEPLDTGLGILNLQPKTWIDKNEYIANGNNPTGLKRYPGFIAEDLDEAGFNLFVHHNEDGSAESVNYGTLVAAIIPVLKNYQSRISELESTIDKMKKA